MRSRTDSPAANAFAFACATIVAFGIALDASAQSKEPFRLKSTPPTPPSEALSEPTTGPVIEDYGPVYPVPKGAAGLEPGRVHRAVMDVSGSGNFIMAINPAFESAARFLNMQARDGVAPRDLRFALVVHGDAAKDLLTDDAYRDRFGVLNPNSRLLERLEEAGVEIYLCGQTAAHRGYRTEDIHPSATLAVSAMTAHVHLQSEGYRLIPF